MRFVKGQTPWNKKEHIKKSCEKCGIEFTVKPSLDCIRYCSISCSKMGKPSNMKGKKTTSEETKEKQRQAKLGIRGPEHWNWRGGSGTERHQAMQRDEYKHWRQTVFIRDKFSCRMCGQTGCELHADHILSWASHPEHRYDVNNGRALCVPCHWTTDSFPERLIPKENRN